MDVRKFKKLPVVIEALRVPLYEDYTAASQVHLDISDYLSYSIALASWCGGTSYMMRDDKEHSPVPGLENVSGPHIAVQTLEGPHAALPGDWIIKGVNGEFYPCKPDIFEKTYIEVFA